MKEVFAGLLLLLTIISVEMAKAEPVPEAPDCRIMGEQICEDDATVNGPGGSGRR